MAKMNKQFFNAQANFARETIRIAICEHALRNDGSALHTICNFASEWLGKVGTSYINLNELETDFVENGYRPTIRPDSFPEAAALADAYDFIMAQRGHAVRAYRGN
jgi:hypothetical protein